ncbi:hypothetical protein [Streptomyces sp. MP131-18]|uniref:hypothetical protein n=1 Tax=Streptomyces sp. MP131-18 TaxID=1857892 RepID=UPI00097BC046|nr:hypothetical protein [Streptomyces sp. MP131-18]ONK12695.1 hypothetical protein STBA_34440 [Streptomyces sp. MP131-18]
MPTYAEIIEQDFEILETAASELDAASDGFEDVAANYRSEVASLPGHEELWVGESAGAASFQFSATEQELDAAKAEARALAAVIRDGKAELVRLRGALEAVVADIRAEGFEVNGEGRVLLDPEWANDTEYERLTRDRGVRQGEVDRAVEAVGQADDSLHLALTQFMEANDGRRAGIFNGAAEDTADEVLAARAHELGGRLAAGEELSADERAELVRLLELEADDPEFARELLDGLGGAGFVDLAAQVGGQVVGGEGDTRRDFVALQDHMRTLLATGTDVPSLEPGSMEHGQWARTEQGLLYGRFMAELDEAGRAEYRVDGLTGQDVRGYQLLTSLMSSGEADYSQRLLHDLADNIRAAEDPSMGGDPDFWLQGSDEAGVDGLDDTDLEWFTVDPMDTMLGIMGDQPPIATSYLDPSGGNGRLEYLIDERDWSHMNMFVTPTQAVDVPTGQDGFGAALQAATTGVPAGERPVELRLTSGGGAITEMVFDKFSANEAALIADGGQFQSLRPELARMTAAYMGDFQAQLSGLEILPEAEGRVELGDRDAVAAFLGQLGRDQEAHGIITGAQQAYTTLAVDSAMTIELPSDVGREEAVSQAVAPGAQMAGVMSEARANAVFEQGIAGDQEHNDRVGMIQDWTGVVLDQAVGAVSARYEVAGAVVEWGVGELSDAIFSTLERDNSDQAAEDARDGYMADYDSAMASASNAVTVAAGERYGEDSQMPRLFRNTVEMATRDNFGRMIDWQPPEGSQQ